MKYRLFLSSVQKEFAREPPKNELIAGPMYLKGYIERLGTGTEDVAKLCAQSGLPAPGFTEGVDFRAVLRRKELGGISETQVETQVGTQAVNAITIEATSDGGTLKASSNASCGDNNLPANLSVNLPVNLPEGLTETAKKIFLLLSGNGKFTYDRLASAVGVTRETVRVSIRSLVDADVIRRVGPDKGGHWEVVK